MNLANDSTTLHAKCNKTEPKDGYDLPVYGIANGSFYLIHIPAIICIVLSFICAVIAITISFRNKDYRSFYTKWSKGERLIVYLSACDGLFNFCHLFDHLHMAITRDHVMPQELCVFYAFNNTLFIVAQVLVVNVVAINAFLLMFFNKNIYFGTRDWRLLLWAFGLPLVGCSLSAGFSQFGPMGIS